MKGHVLLFIVITITLIYMFIHHHYRVNLIYNPQLLDLHTPKDTFTYSPENRKIYLQMTKYGADAAKTKSIIICVLLRDVADKIQNIRKKAEACGEMFRNYRVLIVENDSSDGTRPLLIEWARENPKVVILGCGVNTSVEKCHIPFASKKTEGHGVDRTRIDKMTHLRNMYLEYVEENFPHFDFMCVWDLDIVGSVYLDGIQNTMGWFLSPKSPLKDADVICAYGIRKYIDLKVYYDTYAHLDEGDDFQLKYKYLHDIEKGLSKHYKLGDSPVKCVSCFSGFAVYRLRSVLDTDSYYSISPTDNIECEHVRFHKKLKRIYLNPSMIHVVLVND